MKLGNIGRRALSTAVLAPLALYALYDGHLWFILMVAASGLLLSVEWGEISAPGAPRRIGRAVAAVVVLAILLASSRDLPGPDLLVGDSPMPAAFTALILGAVICGLIARWAKASATDAAYGALYLGWPCLVIVWLRQADEGGRWTILLFTVTWAADIFAYLVGSWLKGPKLAPQLSPAKTWSGFLGGVFAAGLVAALVVAGFDAAGPEWAMTGLDWPAAALLGLAGGLATVAGDLWESTLKRRFGVKDTGSLIPGHGGLLDRVDGLLFAAVVVGAARLVVSWT